MEAALADVARGPLPALVICHGGTIRRVLAARAPDSLPEGTFANGSLTLVGAADD